MSMFDKETLIKVEIVKDICFVLINIIGFIGFMVEMNYFDNGGFSKHFWGIIGWGLFFLLVLLFIYSIYADTYENLIIKPFFEKYGYEYQPSKGLDESLAYSSSILPYYDEYKANKYIKGKDFEVSHIVLKEEREYEDRDGNVSTIGVTVFNGTLLVFYSDRFYNYPLYIEDSKFHISDFLPVFKGEEYRQRMDSPVFERTFDVYCKNAVEARRILTHYVMENFVKIRKEVKFSTVAIRGYKRFVTFEKIEPVKIPPMLSLMTEKTVINSLGGFYYIMRMVKFFRENEL